MTSLAAPAIPHAPDIKIFVEKQILYNLVFKVPTPESQYCYIKTQFVNSEWILFMAYLMMLSVAQTIQHQIIG
jgi:hypothetical protein